jgi:hypothetical protein
LLKLRLTLSIPHSIRRSGKSLLTQKTCSLNFEFQVEYAGNIAYNELVNPTERENNEGGGRQKIVAENRSEGLNTTGPNYKNKGRKQCATSF